MYILKMIFKYSRVLRWVDGVIFAAFWYVQFLRDEFMPAGQAAHMRVIDLVPFSRSTWLLIFSVLAMLTVCEGVSGWYRYEVLPLLGRPGSIQHRCMTMAAALQQLVRAFTSANPEPMSPPEGDVGPRWNWEKAFTRQYDSVARANLKTLIADMKTSDIVCPRCEQVVSLATLNPGQVFEASLQLQELAAIIATTSRRSS